MRNIIGIILKIIILVSIFQTLYITKVNATEGKSNYGNGFWGDIISSADSFVEEGKNNPNIIVNKNTLNIEIRKMYNVLLSIGVAAAVLVGVILGMKYMLESAEEQAKIKETLVAYAIGCVVLFGAFAIWRVVIEILKQV